MSNLQLPPGLDSMMQQRQMAEMQQAQMVGQHLNIATTIFSRLVSDADAATSSNLSNNELDRMAKLSTEAATILMARYGIRVVVGPQEDANGST